MSNKKQSDAKLPGFEGPFFPSCIEVLHQQLYSSDSLSFNGSAMSSFFAAIPGFKGIDRPKTSDGYFCFWSATFELPNGKIAILFPWAQDWNKSDGTSADRHIALHKSGKCADSDIDGIVTQFLNTLKEAQIPQEE